MWGCQSIVVMAILSLTSMCRVHLPIEEEVRSHRQSEYNQQWETESANDLERSALESDRGGLILDDYSQRSVAIITRDKYYTEKLPVVSRTQWKPESYDDEETPEGESDDVLAPDANNRHEDAMSFINETQHVTDELKRERTEEKRTGRIFSIFSLVRFKNEVCTPSGTKNTYMGTCYLATECAERVSSEYCGIKI